MQDKDSGSWRIAAAAGELLGWGPDDSVAALDECVILDPEMKRIWSTLRIVAPTPMPVLILGETGSGKEIAAEWIHRSSGNPGAPFLRLNCASLSESLVESELFGHERGAFTGAQHARVGLFEAADGGTIFLDEIAELPPSTQAKLLRVLESGEIIRVGSRTPKRVSVRIVSATHRNLDEMVEAGTFRRDLYFRINGVSVLLPPLRDRPTEILPLAELFLARAAAKLGKPAPRMNAAAARALCAHGWSGNVRQLRHVMERAVVLAQGDCLAPVDLHIDGAPRAVDSAPAPSRQAGGIRRRVQHFEKDQIVAALAQTRGNQTRAAELLGISRRTLTNKLNLYALRPGRVARQRVDLG